MAHRKKKNAITLDPTRLHKQSVVGCTVLPSRDDPTLASGVALTTIMTFDANYVKFEDIDGQGEPSHRYWKDVYLIVAWDDPNYRHKPLKNGDAIFALFQNADTSFTTVYYNAKIRQLPHTNSQNITIDFPDGSGKYVNIQQKAFTNLQTKDGVISVPTIIRKICADNSSAHKTAMLRFNRKASMQTNENHPSNVSVSASLTPVKKPHKRHKKKVLKSDSNSPNVARHETHKNVVTVNVNTRKRKFDEINTNRNNKQKQSQSTGQPPPKRQRSSRRKQKLKKAVTAVNNATNGGKITKNILHKAATVTVAKHSQQKAKPKTNKRIIKIKRKPKVKKEKKSNNNILPQPPSIPMAIPSKPKPKSTTVSVAVPVALPTVTQKIQKLPPPPPPPVIQIQQFQRKKFKKMWGNYDVELPTAPHGFELFDGDLYLDNFNELTLAKNKNIPQNEQHFISGLGLTQKWIQPQEIGEITVGPYVVDIDMFNVVTKL